MKEGRMGYEGRKQGRKIESEEGRKEEERRNQGRPRKRVRTQKDTHAIHV